MQFWQLCEKSLAQSLHLFQKFQIFREQRRKRICERVVMSFEDANACLNCT